MELSSSSRNLLLDKKSCNKLSSEVQSSPRQTFSRPYIETDGSPFIKRELEIAIKMDSPFSFQELGFQYISIP